MAKERSMALEEKLKQLQEKVKQNPLTSITILIAVLLLLLIVVPYLQVNYRGINNATVEATLENQSRATLAQILGGVAIGIGLYYTWRRITIGEENLKVSQEGQITERFTRAVDQLGSEKLEIRLGGIYALERIANESEKDYWPIMEILTAYIREKLPIEDNIEEGDIKNQNKTSSDSKVKIPIDIQAILTVIRRRKYSFGAGESVRLDLSRTCLLEISLSEINLERINFGYANLTNALFQKANLKQAVFVRASLEDAEFRHVNIENAVFIEAHLENTKFYWVNLKDALLIKAYIEETVFLEPNLKRADFDEANLTGASFIWADLTEAQNLTVEQLSKVKTLYNAKLDPELEEELRAKGYSHLLDDEPKDEP